MLGQDADDLGGALDFATATGRGSDVGRYRVTPEGLTSRNYDIAFEAGTLTIDPARLTVTAEDASRTYGQANPDFTARYQGFVLGQDADDLGGALGFATAAGRGSDVGRYRVTPEGLTSRNYAIAFEAGTLTVDPARLTVTAEDASRTYGAGQSDFTARYEGFVLGQDADDLGGALDFATATGRGSDVGRYRVTPEGLTSRNYAIAFEAGTLTIDPARLTVTAEDASRTYGQANPDFTARYQGFVLGQDADDLGGALGFATAAGRGSDVGRYRVTPERADQPQLRHRLRGRDPHDRPGAADGDRGGRGAGDRAAEPGVRGALRRVRAGRGRGRSAGRARLRDRGDRGEPGRALRGHPGRRREPQLRHRLRGRHADRHRAARPGAGAGGRRHRRPDRSAAARRAAADPRRRELPHHRGRGAAGARQPLRADLLARRDRAARAGGRGGGQPGLRAGRGRSGAAGSQGFVPAAGGSGAETPAAPAVAGVCSGAINRGVPSTVCARQAVEESYWTTVAGEGTP